MFTRKLGTAHVGRPLWANMFEQFFRDRFPSLDECVLSMFTHTRSSVLLLSNLRSSISVHSLPNPFFRVRWKFYSRSSNAPRERERKGRKGRGGQGERRFVVTFLLVHHSNDICSIEHRDSHAIQFSSR